MEAVPAAAHENYGQGYAYVAAVDGGDMPFVGIPHVAVEILFHIETAGLLRFGLNFRSRSRQAQQQDKQICKQLFHSSTQASTLSFSILTTPPLILIV